MGEMFIRLAYGVMIVGMILCFVFSRNHEKDLRKAADEFAIAFVKLSNHISPFPPKEELLTETLPDGRIRALPAEQQPEAIQAILKRANSGKSVRLFKQLRDASDLVTERASINRTHKAQFKEPIESLLLLTHTFLVGCENLSTIDTPEKKQAFESFLQEQPQHRMVLLKRITGELSDEYRKLNKVYAEEMERMEAEEQESRRKGKGKNKKNAEKEKPAAEKQPAREQKEQPAAPAAAVQPEQAAQPVQAPAEQPAPEPAAAAQAEPADEESLRDKWRGWGCC